MQYWLINDVAQRAAGLALMLDAYSQSDAAIESATIELRLMVRDMRDQARALGQDQSSGRVPD